MEKRVTITKHYSTPSCDGVMVAAWRVIKFVTGASATAVYIDEHVEEPDADPLVVLRFPGDKHLLLWMDRLWATHNYDLLLGGTELDWLTDVMAKSIIEEIDAEIIDDLQRAGICV